MGDKDIVIHFFQRLYEFPVIKVVAGIFLWVLQALYGTVFRPAYGIVMLLWIADTATGYYHARANPAIKPESRRMYHGLVKLAIYYGLLFLGHQFSYFSATVFIQSVIETAIILTEGYSVLENLQKIAVLKGVNIPFLDQIMGIVQGKINKIDGGGVK